MRIIIYTIYNSWIQSPKRSLTKNQICYITFYFSQKLPYLKHFSILNKYSGVLLSHFASCLYFPGICGHQKLARCRRRKLEFHLISFWSFPENFTISCAKRVTRSIKWWSCDLCFIAWSKDTFLDFKVKVTRTSCWKLSETSWV